jgi:hypothetical protein
MIKYLEDGHRYVTCRSDMSNVLWWSIFGILLVFQINNGIINLKQFWKYVYRFVFIGSVLSAFIGLFKYFNILNNNLSPSFYYNKKLIIGSSLNSDYNIFAFGLFLGSLYSFELYKYLNSYLLKFCFYFGNIIIILSMFLSGSRRGIILFFSIILLFVLYKKIKELKFQIQLFRLFKPPLIFIILFVYYFYENGTVLLENSGFIDKSISRIFTVVDQITGENERTIRFNWVFNNFNKASIFEQIFGKGFSYLHEMGMRFRVSEDYPHNFLLSSLLFGGIISFFFSALLVYNLFQSSFSNDKILYFTLLFFIFITFTSSNYLFSYRIFPILTFLASIPSNKYHKFTENKLF